METNKLKKFATEARSRLRAGVATKIRSLGFDADGNAVPGMEPTPMVGGCTWNGQILPSAFAEQWEALRRRLKAKGLKEVVEEGASSTKRSTGSAIPFIDRMRIAISRLNHV